MSVRNRAGVFFYLAPRSWPTVDERRDTIVALSPHTREVELVAPYYGLGAEQRHEYHVYPTAFIRHDNRIEP